MNLPLNAPICFVLDDAMGSLLKWLRMLGFDTIYRREYKNSIEQKKDKQTIHLTQSKTIGSQGLEKIIHLEQGPVVVQLHDVMVACGIARDRVKAFTRCIVCNRKTLEIRKTGIRGKIPEYVWEIHETFRECPACRRIYWRGTHAEKINETIEKIFGGSGEARGQEGELKSPYHENTKKEK